MSASGSIAPAALLDLRFVRDARLSADGQSVAYCISRTVQSEDAEYCELWIRDLGTGELTPVAVGPTFASAPRWSPRGDQLAFLTATVNGSRLHVFTLADGMTREVTSLDLHFQGAPTWSPDGTRLAACTLRDAAHGRNRRITSRVALWDGRGLVEGAQSSIRIFNLELGTCVVDFLTDAGVCGQPQWAPSGDQILVLTTSADRHSAGRYAGVSLINAATGEVRELLGESWAIEAAQWCPDGARIVVAGTCSSPEAVPAAALWVVNVDGSGQQRRTDATIPHVGFRFHHDMPVWDMSATVIVADEECAFVTVQAGGYSSIYRVSLAGPLQCVQAIGGNRSCILLDVCPTEGWLLFWITSFDTPSELCIARWNQAGSERQLTDLNSALMNGWPSMRVQPLSFVSADGLEVEGWYMGRADQAGPSPTVMFIHGGPYMGTGCVFRFDFWMLASHGYAVLFANFRGSIGYGSSFSRAIEPDWGTQGFPDHMAAVDAAVAEGLAVPQRLGVWGASHGGFATAWIVGHTDRFRAAVAEAAITDFRTLYYLSDTPDFVAARLGGKPQELAEVYRARSPLTYAHRCQTPTLVLQGLLDRRCPPAGAESFFRALLDAGCVAELVELDGCDHIGDSMGPLSARLGQNEALLDWFMRHL